jgi:sugar phosphate isomerase/epimerase
MRIVYVGSTWGIECPTVEGTLRKLQSAGFDGVEMGAPADGAERRELKRLLEGLGMSIVAQQWSAGGTPAEHARSLEEQYRRNIELEPILVNSHTGKDYFTAEENVTIFRRALELEEECGVPIAHETHRGRAPFSTVATMAFLDALPGLRLTADFSHWCTVHESLLEDQAGPVARAIERTIHIHARVGHPEGPQVPDPRAPEWSDAVDAHFGWWREIVEHRRRIGSELLTITPEFGPPRYMQTLPYTRQPVADLWEVDRAMKGLLQSRLGG